MRKEVKMVMVTVILLLSFASINVTSAANVYNISADSYSNYFNESGYIKGANIKAGDVLDVYGTIYDKNMYIDRPLNITSSSKTGKIINGTINILSGGSGSNVTGLRINNTRDGVMGIFLKDTQNNTIKGNTIQCDGSSGHGIALTGSNCNNILENNLSEFETTVGWTHSPIILGNSNYNNIKNNYIISRVSNCIYLSIYGSGGGLCYYNNITDNTCIGVDTSWCYAIQMMGSYNIARNNTITVSNLTAGTYGKGAYRGISSESGGNTITGNTIYATYCGIFASGDSIISGNTIYGYKDDKTADYTNQSNSGITTGSNCTVTDNIVNMFYGGYGIYVTGNSNITENKITTADTSKESIYIYGGTSGINISRNIINSNSTGVLLKKQSSSKCPTNTTINDNEIITTSTYAIDSTGGTSTTIKGNYMNSNGKRGNDAVASASGDVVTGNSGKLLPSADVGSGSFNKGITVHLTAVDNNDPNPRIYYTLDGSVPTVGSTLYTGSISVSKEGITVLKFIAVNLDGEVSDVVTKTYIVDTKVPTASVNVPGGTYNVSKSVALSMSESGSIYYTLDGSTPTTGSTKYAGSFSVGSTCTLKFLAVDKAGNKSPVYTVKYVIDKTAPKASASVKAGTYNVSKSVILKMSESGSIYYTLNGKTPTTSNARYTKPINMASTHTLKFFAVDKAGNKSPVYTVKYVIDKAAPKVSLTSPKNKAGKVSRTGTIAVKFSESVKAGVNWSKVYIKNLKTGKKVAVSKVIKGNILYLKTTSKKSSYTWYQVYIPAYAVKDSAGNKLAKAYTFKFKTGK
ncbi:MULTISPECIES: chitobiase/beta-hexosaminidase C-terminal domain-containing protein [Methanobacterium]|uniref:SbsA Ig-like domain-containing protein n=1 Tax=Methanobacterium bryantii TaxID=2161 RepID=A0A2A2H5P8_METBR|nr:MULTISPECIES: chitobiase/beta-hexosaminidase C-terminal domain-containing protein [Methanobacterium]OEC88712.1 hypothetical protein A9507_03250 [Methanobacterium sp. A39]PAV04722.1 hypothetical protein ASJ80_10415 [Methanobacterium bryantii]